MADSQDPRPEQTDHQNQPSRPWVRWLGVGAVAGSALLLVGAGAAWRGWVWLQGNLSPWLEAELTEALNRPVVLGDVERLTLSGVRVGPSQIPATDTDADSLSLQSVDVAINLWDLRRRELILNVVVESADLYLEQDADGQWVALDLDLPERDDTDRDPWVNVQPGTVQLRNSRVVAVPYDRRNAQSENGPDQTPPAQASAASAQATSPRIELTDLQGQIEFGLGTAGLPPGRQPRIQTLDFDISGSSVAGGSTQAKGSVQLPRPAASQNTTAPNTPSPENTSSENTSHNRQFPATTAEAVTPQPATTPYPTALQAVRQWLTGLAPAWAQDDPAAAQPLRAKVNLRAQDLTALDVFPLMESFLAQPLPVQVSSGTLSGTVDITLGEDPPTYTGTARVAGGAVIIPGLPEPVQNLQGDIRFQGRTLAFENVTAALGDLTAQAGGTLDLDGSYDFAGRVNPFTVAQMTDLFGADLPVAAAGTLVAEVAVAGPFAQSVVTTKLLSQGPVTVDQVALAEVQAQTTFRGNNPSTNQGATLTIDSIRAVPQAGGSLTGSGLWALGSPGRLSLALTGERLPGDALAQPYGLPDTVTLGPVSFEANLAGPVDQLVGQARWRAPLATYPAQGRVNWANQTLTFTDTFVQVAGGTVAGSGTLGLEDRRWQADVRATGLSLATLGSTVAGDVNGRGELRGTLGNNALTSIEGQAVAQAVLAAGGVVNGRAALSQGQWQANVVGQQLPLAAFSPTLQGTGSGQFAFSGPVQSPSLETVRGQGNVVLSDGLASAAAFAPQLAAVREPLRADLAWDGQSIQVNQASTAGLRASGTVTPQLQGTPGLANVNLNLTANGVNLAALPIPGQVLPVGGIGGFEGRLVGRPGTFRLTGDARLNDLRLGELAFATPMTGPVFYDQQQGFTVDLRDPSQQTTGDQILATSQQDPYDLKFTLRRGPTLAAGHLQGSDLFATVTNLPLDDLRLPQEGVAGIGTVSGTIESAIISGNWREPNLQAQFDIVDPGLGYITLPQGQTVAQGEGDPGNNQSTAPTPLEVRYGRLRGTLRYANQLVSLVGGELTTASENSRYLLSGTYALDGSQRVNGELVVDNAQIQDILLTFKIFELSDFRANLLQPPAWFRPTTAADLASLGTTQVGNRNASFLDQLRRFAEVQALQDRLIAEAEAAVLPPLEGLEGNFSGTVTAQGTLPRDLRVEVDLAGENWLWRDPNHANGIGYRIDSLLAQATYENDVLRLRPIRLVSNFSGDPDATTLATAELNGDLSLRPEEDSNRTLRLNITDLPLAAVRRPLRIPDTFDGIINAGASLTGSLLDPQVRGRLAVNEATINRQPVDVASADFLYQEARLSLRSNIAIEDQVDPLTLVASVPLPLAGTNQTPSRDDVTVRLRLKDQGFALINLFTQAVTWEEGLAELALNVDGSWPVNRPLEDALTSLVVTGAASFDGVTISSRSLPEPLTNLRGDVVVLEGQGSQNSLYFNGLVLDVRDLQGDFSAGQLAAQGQLKVIPSINDLFPGVVGSPFGTEADPADPPDDRLRLTLDNIALDLRNAAGTYQGNLDGEVVVGGSLYLLEPLISGNLRLSNGVATLPESQDETVLVGGGGGGSARPSIFQPVPPVLEDFSITLGNNVRLAIPGVVDVTAQGDLNLVGTVPDIRPDGRIMLPSGRINLLTTEFRLTGDENYAEFSANDEVIDPYLVANLSAAVSDTLGNNTNLAAATPFPRIEINDAPISQLGLTQNGIQTIRIRANVDGRASRVLQLQGVELTSTPPRTEGEIITLISSEFLTALESTLGSVSGGGDNFQGLLAFAGSAVLNRLQNLIGAGLDNTELRLYSASPPGSNQVDVGGEVSFNVSPSLGLSVQKVFTNVTPALFGVRYRITDQITVRGITSYEQFNENTGAIVEFRF